MDTLQLSLRDTRDRLIDFLGVGNTFPLSDVILQKDSLKVPFSTDKQPSTAKIIFTYWQRDVTYQLYDQDGQNPVGKAIDGNQDVSQTLQLESLPITENLRFKILATKTKTKSGKSQFLQQMIEVKVGLDTSLKAYIDAPLLNPKVDQPAFDTPRLVDIDTKVQVNVVDCQEGVEYGLVYFGTDNKEIGRSPVSILSRKLGDDIVLAYEPVKKDGVIRIFATKKYDPADNKADESQLLDAVLPLKVRANPALAVSVDAVVDFNGKAAVNVDSTEEAVTYQLYLQAIPDRYFVHGTVPTDLPVLQVLLPDKTTVTLRRPPRSAEWETPDGFTFVDVPQQGNKDTLSFPLTDLKGDTVVIVQATKNHAIGTSSIQLAQAVAVLVRPNPSLPKLKAALNANKDLQAPIQVTGGQPGVFYAFSNEQGPLGSPVYFNQPDPEDPNPGHPTRNKGIGQLVVEVDFVVLQNMPESVTVPPQPPLLDSQALSASASLSIKAIKAQTGVAITLGPAKASDLLEGSG